MSAGLLGLISYSCFFSPVSCFFWWHFLLCSELSPKSERRICTYWITDTCHHKLVNCVILIWIIPNVGHLQMSALCYSLYLPYMVSSSRRPPATGNHTALGVHALTHWPWGKWYYLHYSDVIMGTIAYQITSPTAVYSTDYSDADQIKKSKLRVTGLCVGNSAGPVNSPHKWPVTRKMFPFDDVLMCPRVNATESIDKPLLGHGELISKPLNKSFRTFADLWVN